MEGLTRETLRPLLDLQQADVGIERLTQRCANLPEQRELDELQQERSEIAKSRDERQGALDDALRHQARLEGDVAMLEEKITRESGRLYGGEISSPKELSGIQAELDALRRRKAHVEDQLIDVMEGREAIEVEMAALSLGEIDRRIAEAAARRDGAAVDIARELAQMESRRAELRPLFPEDLLDVYDDLRARKDGVGAAAFEGGVCRGCNVTLTPAARDAIRRSADPVVRCENCRRILVIM